MKKTRRVPNVLCFIRKGSFRQSNGNLSGYPKKVTAIC
jgi:hypothetical protein